MATAGSSSELESMPEATYGLTNFDAQDDSAPWSRSKIRRLQRLHTKRCSSVRGQDTSPNHGRALKCVHQALPAIAAQLDYNVNSLKQVELAPDKYGADRATIKRLRLQRNRALHPSTCRHSSSSSDVLLPPPAPPPLLYCEDLEHTLTMQTPDEFVDDYDYDLDEDRCFSWNTDAPYFTPQATVAQLETVPNIGTRGCVLVDGDSMVFEVDASCLYVSRIDAHANQGMTQEDEEEEDNDVLG